MDALKGRSSLADMVEVILKRTGGILLAITARIDLDRERFELLIRNTKAIDEFGRDGSEVPSDAILRRKCCEWLMGVHVRHSQRLNARV